jgi:hypothetical protein
VKNSDGNKECPDKSYIQIVTDVFLYICISETSYTFFKLKCSSPRFKKICITKYPDLFFRLLTTHGETATIQNLALISVCISFFPHKRDELTKRAAPRYSRLSKSCLRFCLVIHIYLRVMYASSIVSIEFRPENVSIDMQHDRKRKLSCDDISEIMNSPFSMKGAEFACKKSKV